MINYLNDDGVRELSSLVNTDIQKVKNDLSQVSDSVNDLSNTVVEIKNKLIPSKYRYADMYVNLYRIRLFVYGFGVFTQGYDVVNFVDLNSGLAMRRYNGRGVSGYESTYIYNLYNNSSVMLADSYYYKDFSPDKKFLLCWNGSSNCDLWFYTIENEEIVSKYISLKSKYGISYIGSDHIYYANPDYVYFLKNSGNVPYILKVSDGTLYNILTDVFKGGVTLYYDNIKVVPCKDKNTMYIALRQSSSSKYSFFMIKNLLQQNQEIVEFTPTNNVGDMETLSHFDVIDEDVIYSSIPNNIFILNRSELTIDMKNLNNVDSSYSIYKYFGCLKNESEWTFYRYDMSKGALVPYKKIEPLPVDFNNYVWSDGCISLHSCIYGYPFNVSGNDKGFKTYSVSYAIDL